MSDRLHAHAHQHSQDGHTHGHHHPGHVHPPAAVGMSFVRMSVFHRLLVAAGASVLVWLVVIWALAEGSLS